jgi:putative CocE/NonD family hydrolase
MNVKNSYRNLSPANFEVEVKKNVFIPMPDGIHLAAGLYRPRAKGSFPVILVFMPYGKDLEAAYGGPYQRDLWFFAQRGYVGVFVDFRGTGNSEGALPGYWSNQEFQDGRDVIKWIMVQEWCNGGVGMHGLSYGGMSSIRVAAMNPKGLRTISLITVPWPISIGNTSTPEVCDVQLPTFGYGEIHRGY